MAYYSTVWFWLMVVGVVLLIAGIIWYFAAGSTATSTVRTFIYALIAFGALLLLIGVIFAIFDSGTSATVATSTTVATTPATTVTTTKETVTTPIVPPSTPVQTTVTQPMPVNIPVIQPTQQIAHVPHQQYMYQNASMIAPPQYVSQYSATPMSPVVSQQGIKTPIGQTYYQLSSPVSIGSVTPTYYAMVPGQNMAVPTA
jgi:hypothetical protein